MNSEYALIRVLHPILEQLEDLHRKVDRIMASQSDVDADLAAVNVALSDLATATATIQTELDTLASANPGIDLGPLTAAVAQLDPAAQAIGALVPTPPPAA